MSHHPESAFRPEFELPNGVEIIQVSPQSMAEILKTAPTLVRWPFTEEIRGTQPRMNVGASTCLITYDFSNEPTVSGHFTVVHERKSADSKEKDELKVYRQWLLHVQSLIRKDPDAVIVLLGQHVSNLSQHKDSRLMHELSDQRRSQVDQDLMAIGVNSDKVLDLRGPDIGSTAAVYNPGEKKLFYTKYPPRS